MSILRRVFVASFVVFAFAFTSFASTINSNTSPRAAVALAATLHSPLLPLYRPASTRPAVKVQSPPDSCTILNSGEQWKDPSTGETWQCICFEKYHDGGVGIVCNWALLLPKPDPSTWIDLNSSLFMDVDRVSKDNGARIHQWTFTNGANQWWGMNGGPYVMTAVSVNSGKCLGVNGGSSTQGASIIQWSCNGHSDQAWVWAWTGSFAPSGWPIWNIVNANSHMCLGISGASRQVGAYAVQWSCNGSPDQGWW